MQQQVAFGFGIDRMHAMGDRGRHAVRPGNLDLLGFVHELRGQRLDLGRERRREQQGLATCRQRREHALHLRQEAHVEHAVGFVEDEPFDRGQVDGALLHVVEQAPRGGDDDVDAAAQGVDLRTHADAAEDRRRFRADVLAVGAHAVLHLGGEFARRGEDQGARLARRDGAARGAQVQVFEQGQGEGSGLAGAGLRARHDVAAGEHDRDGRRLHRRRLGVVLFGDRAQERGRQPEGVETHLEDFLNVARSVPVNRAAGLTLRPRPVRVHAGSGRRRPNGKETRGARTAARKPEGISEGNAGETRAW